MASVQKLPSGKWRVRIDVPTDGKRIVKSFTDASLAQARAKANAYLADSSRKKDPDNKTLGEAMDEFIDNRSNILSPSTIANYRVLRNSAYATIIDVKLPKLTPTMVQRCINAYCEDRAYKTVFNASTFLSSILREYRPDLKYKVLLPQKNKTELVIPTAEQVSLLIEKSRGSSIHVPIMLASMLGMRRSEICALNWDKIDLETKTIMVDEAVVLDEFNILIRKAPKTTLSQRRLDLPQQIIDALPSHNKPIITMQPSTLTHLFRKLTKKLGFNFTFHALRHYCASVMLQLGVPDKYAMERMGHSTNNMLKQVYQHTFASEQSAITDKMQHYFNEHIEVEQNKKEV